MPESLSITCINKCIENQHCSQQRPPTKREKMSALSIFDLREKVIRKNGAEAACPYCGGPVLAIDFDAHLRFCFLPISHKVKKKFYCTICSRRLVPATS